jgi:hypothetical protein
MFPYQHGGHFEHLLQCSLAADAHKLNVSGHTLIWAYLLVFVRGTRSQTLSAPFSYTL